MLFEIYKFPQILGKFSCKNISLGNNPLHRLELTDFYVPVFNGHVMAIYLFQWAHDVVLFKKRIGANIVSSMELLSNLFTVAY